MKDGIDTAHFPALRAFLAALKEAPPSEDGVERNFSHMPKMCAGPGNEKSKSPKILIFINLFR